MTSITHIGNERLKACRQPGRHRISPYINFDVPANKKVYISGLYKQMFKFKYSRSEYYQIEGKQAMPGAPGETIFDSG